MASKLTKENTEGSENHHSSQIVDFTIHPWSIKLITYCMVEPGEYSERRDHFCNFLHMISNSTKSGYTVCSEKCTSYTPWSLRSSPQKQPVTGLWILLEIFSANTCTHTNLLFRWFVFSSSLQPTGIMREVSSFTINFCIRNIIYCLIVDHINPLTFILCTWERHLWIWCALLSLATNVQDSSIQVGYLLCMGIPLQFPFASPLCSCALSPVLHSSSLNILSPFVIVHPLEKAWGQNFYMSENVFIPCFPLIDSFAEYRILDWKQFLSDFERIALVFSRVAVEKCETLLIADPLPSSVKHKNK